MIQSSCFLLLLNVHLRHAIGYQEEEERRNEEAWCKWFAPTTTGLQEQTFRAYVYCSSFNRLFSWNP